MAVNVETRPCLTEAWASQYIEYHELKTGVLEDFLSGGFSSIDLGLNRQIKSCVVLYVHLI